MHNFLDLLKHKFYFLKIEKCEFEKSSIEFLGWLITLEGITINPSKAAGLAHWLQKLYNIKDLCYMLGILGYQ